MYGANQDSLIISREKGLAQPDTENRSLVYSHECKDGEDAQIYRVHGNQI